MKNQMKAMAREIGQDTINDMKNQIKAMAREIGQDTINDTINDMKNQMKAMAREIAVIKSQPQSGGGVAAATQPVAGSLKQGHIYVFMGESCIVHTPRHTHTRTHTQGARVQIFEVVDTSCYFWLSCILLNVKPSRTIFQRATFSNQCTSLRKLRLYPCP